jgi:hypothetical protein
MMQVTEPGLEHCAGALRSLGPAFQKPSTLHHLPDALSAAFISRLDRLPKGQGFGRGASPYPVRHPVERLRGVRSAVRHGSLNQNDRAASFAFLCPEQIALMKQDL